MQFTTNRSKQKEYDIYLKSEKLVHSQLFRSTKNLETKKCSSQCQEQGKRFFSLLFGDQKMQFTTVRNKEKDYNIYLKSEKLVHSQQEHEKYVSQLFGSGKNWFLAISSLTNTVATIWREKKVDPCYLESKKCSLQLLGAKKKIMTSI